jgi:nitroimidazol reductase NimA-like FMN-containing flavoprotein (pyridoxamine 5'-phosphate oxidase superfamily)
MPYMGGMTTFPITERTRVRRLPQRAHHEREKLYAILDEALICHVGFAVEGQPYVIPTTHVRVGDVLYIHGSAASRMLEVAESGVALCTTVTLIDGLVFARSAFHHSMNYRSAVVLGQATLVADLEEKRRVLTALVERFAEGRSQQVRAPTPLELKATSVLAMHLAEVSVKMRSGPPLDDAADLSRPCWAGVVPLQLVPSSPLPEASLSEGVALPVLPAALRCRA